MLENGLSIDLTEIEQFIRGQGLGESVSFQNLVERLMAGDLTGLCSQLLSGLQSALFQEIGSGGRILGQILALGIFAAVFTSFSGLFQESQVSETGFFGRISASIYTFDDRADPEHPGSSGSSGSHHAVYESHDAGLFSCGSTGRWKHLCGSHV